MTLYIFQLGSEILAASSSLARILKVVAEYRNDFSTAYGKPLTDTQIRKELKDYSQKTVSFKVNGENLYYELTKLQTI